MSNIIQVTNIAATVTEDNIKTLFGFVGPIREMIVYFENAQQEETKVAYIVFESNNDAETSLHLHNTVFHDRAIIVSPLADSRKGQIPDLSYATMVRAPEKTVTGITPKSKNWPSDVLSMVVGRTGEQSIITIDPNFIKQELPNYPNLPYSTEVAKIDEIRRTVLVTNLEAGTSPQQVLDFFQPVAEVKFIRMAGSEHDNAAYVEFSEQMSVAKAFGMMGSKLGARAVMIQHSNVAINKSTSSSNHRGGDDTSSRRIKGSTSRSRSKKRSRSRRRSRSRPRRSRSHRHSGSKSKKRSKSRSRRGSKSRKRSRSRRGSKPRSSRRSRSRHGSKTRSQRRSRSRHHRERGPESKSREERSKKRSVSRDKKKERSRSRHRRDRKDSKSRHTSKDKKVKKEVIDKEDKPKEKKHRSDHHHKSKEEKNITSNTNENSDTKKHRTSSESTTNKVKTGVTASEATPNGNDTTHTKTVTEATECNNVCPPPASCSTTDDIRDETADV